MQPGKALAKEVTPMAIRPMLTVRIVDREPSPALAAAALEIWKGGATDLATRTMIANPPRWLVLGDHEAARAQPSIDRADLAWDLEQILTMGQVSPIAAAGVILVSMDVDRDREQEFNDWYNTEHIPRLSALPGVLTARRFRAARGAPAYVALYHVENSDIYAEQAWVAANQTPWMLRMRRFQRHRTYFMFRTRVA
jgi:hypothetical protein